MSPINEQLMIDHLDSSLQGIGLPDVEQLIKNDRQAAGEWQYLLLAVDAIEEAAIYEQVTVGREHWVSKKSADAVKFSRTKVTRMYRNITRVASCLLVLAGGSAVYKYTTTSATGMYNEYFTNYELNTTRSIATADPMEQAYNEKKWAEVITLFNTSKEKNNQSYFLTGMANLQLKDYPEAIEKFKQVLAENNRSGSDLFQDEAEYYLVMSYLANNEAEEALPLIEKIKADKNHLYHPLIGRMSSLDLRIIRNKARK
jgi:tetratricopeptide (TPR) repeat protein